jgi:hypothetical protein
MHALILWSRRGVRAGAAVVLLAFLWAPAAVAQSNAGAASLQIPPGARAEGMGRFFSSVANDAFTPWWNPGGLAFMRGVNAGLMHAKLVPGLAEDVYFEYMAGSTYLEGWGGAAITLTYLTYGESARTNEGSSDPIGVFSSFEFAPSVALGTAITDNLGVGANLKLIHVSLDPDSDDGKGTTFGADLGALFRTNSPMEDFFGMGPADLHVGVGAVLSNLGPDIALSDQRDGDPLPRNLKLSGSVGVGVPESVSLLTGFTFEKSLIFESIPDSTSADLSWFKRNDVILSGGFEIGFMDLAFGRIGYIYDDPGTIKSFTYGAGFYLSKFGIDFASIPQALDLPRVSKISLTAKFD